MARGAGGVREGRRAAVALVRLLPRVGPHVLLEVAGLEDGFAAVNTQVALEPRPLPFPEWDDHLVAVTRLGLGELDVQPHQVFVVVDAVGCP